MGVALAPCVPTPIVLPIPPVRCECNRLQTKRVNNNNNSRLALVSAQIAAAATTQSPIKLEAQAISKSRHPEIEWGIQTNSTLDPLPLALPAPTDTATPRLLNRSINRDRLRPTIPMTICSLITAKRDNETQRTGSASTLGATATTTKGTTTTTLRRRRRPLPPTASYILVRRNATKRSRPPIHGRLWPTATRRPMAP